VVGFSGGGKFKKVSKKFVSANKRGVRGWGWALGKEAKSGTERGDCARKQRRP